MSAYGSDFNYDFHVSFTKDEVAAGQLDYNYGMREFASEEAPGASVFYKDGTGTVFHTYSGYARGLDMLIGAYNYFDLVPKGRDEDGLAFTMAWVRHHDRYGGQVSQSNIKPLQGRGSGRSSDAAFSKAGSLFLSQCRKVRSDPDARLL